MFCTHLIKLFQFIWFCRWFDLHSINHTWKDDLLPWMTSSGFHHNYGVRTKQYRNVQVRLILQYNQDQLEKSLVPSSHVEVWNTTTYSICAGLDWSWLAEKHQITFWLLKYIGSVIASSKQTDLLLHEMNFFEIHHYVRFRFNALGNENEWHDIVFRAKLSRTQLVCRIL